MSTDFVQFDGGIPENYDQGLGPHLFVDYGLDLAARVAVSRPQQVLELASGTGIVTRQIRDAIDPEATLVATDLSEPMLKVAAAKFTENESVTFQQADAMALPFDDASFDTVACQFGVMFFPDKDVSYREAHRVLKPGGRYVFSVWCSFDENPFAAVAQATVEKFFADDPPGFYHLPFSYCDADEIQSSLVAAGFSDITLEAKQIEKTVEDFDLFARGLVLGNPLVGEIRDRASADPETVRSAIAAALRSEFGKEPCTMPLKAIVITAMRSS